ncbi:MAG: UDP-N-acetylglucosamine 1-carboxyvinyltransferase [Candidatus Eiseniibacteriota bacterium]
MDCLVIQGGQPLQGTVAVSGAKNAALPLMAATLLAPGEHVLTRVPRLADTRTMVRVLEALGAKVRWENGILRIDSSTCSSVEAPYELVKTMRASVYVLGPLLARFGRARVSLPGGCAWGPRPVDLHIRGMEALGATVEIDEGYIVADAGNAPGGGGLRGTRFTFPISSVGATGNLLMAAVLARGVSEIENAAIEPEITQLAQALVTMGAQIEGIGTTHLTVEGVEELTPAKIEVIPDRIEAATYLAAGAITLGEVTVTHCQPGHLGASLGALEAAGSSITVQGTSVTLKASGRPRAFDLTTAVFPGFATDMQAQMMALATLGDGTSTITDTIYHDRFAHAPELARMGADIRVENNAAVVHGKPFLKGAPVMATDLRASAALVLAGLAAEGETRVSRIYHLDRGYEALADKLASLGARVERQPE